MGVSMDGSDAAGAAPFTSSPSVALAHAVSCAASDVVSNPEVASSEVAIAEVAIAEVAIAEVAIAEVSSAASRPA